MPIILWKFLGQSEKEEESEEMACIKVVFIKVSLAHVPKNCSHVLNFINFQEIERSYSYGE